MAWISPLSMETWIISIFSGSANIFLAVALIVIMGLAAFFRMNGLVLMFMVGLFFMMFSQWINIEIYFLLIAIASILAGYWISRLIPR